MPSFLYLYEPGIAIGFLLGLLSGTIVFTWLYSSTDGSVLVVELFHNVFNITVGYTSCKEGAISAIVSTLINGKGAHCGECV